MVLNKKHKLTMSWLLLLMHPLFGADSENGKTSAGKFGSSHWGCWPGFPVRCWYQPAAALWSVQPAGRSIKTIKNQFKSIHLVDDRMPYLDEMTQGWKLSSLVWFLIGPSVEVFKRLSVRLVCDQKEALFKAWGRIMELRNVRIL